MYIMYSCICIQNSYRNMLVYRLNLIHGPARINRNICVNDTDFFTLDNIKDINYDNFFSYTDNDHTYGFNIQSIYNLLKKNKNYNPYTLKNFDYKLINNIEEFLKLSKILKIKLEIELPNTNISYENRLTNIFHEIDLLGNYTNPNWFKKLSTRRKLIFLRELHDIWVYRANIDNNTKFQICPNGDPFLNLNINNIYNNVAIENFNNICLNIIENFILNGVNINSKSLGALYVLSALTIVSPEAAQAMPWLFESVNYN